MQLSAEPIRTVQKPESVSNTGECDVRISVCNYSVKMHLPRPWTKIKYSRQYLNNSSNMWVVMKYSLLHSSVRDNTNTKQLSNAWWSHSALNQIKLLAGGVGAAGGGISPAPGWWARPPSGRGSWRAASSSWWRPPGPRPASPSGRGWPPPRWRSSSGWWRPSSASPRRWRTAKSSSRGASASPRWSSGPSPGWWSRTAPGQWWSSAGRLSLKNLIS